MGSPTTLVLKELSKIDVKQWTKAQTKLTPKTEKQQKITETKPVCTHSDGAIKVAEYIVAEIKTNVKSETAKVISYHIGDGYQERLKEWMSYPFWKQALIGMPEMSMGSALATWFMAVNTGRPWDHKPKIRQKFKSVAVHRPLPGGAPSESYYHKYKDHDYYLDVWSNIHYGYVGLSVGFSQQILLGGSDVQQFIKNLIDLSFGGDTIDDETTMKIGFELYKKFGKYAEKLTAQDVLSVLEAKPNNLIPVSRPPHWCWSSRNPNPAEKPTK